MRDGDPEHYKPGIPYYYVVDDSGDVVYTTTSYLARRMKAVIAKTARQVPLRIYRTSPTERFICTSITSTLKC
jgi:hypothetical protein